MGEGIGKPRPLPPWPCPKKKGVLRAKGLAEAIPNMEFCAGTLLLPRAKGELWSGRPEVFCLQLFSKENPEPAMPLGSAPAPKGPPAEPVTGVVVLSGDSSQSIGVTIPPKAKGRGAEMPNTGPPAPAACFWVPPPMPCELLGLTGGSGLRLAGKCKVALPLKATGCKVLPRVGWAGAVWPRVAGVDSESPPGWQWARFCPIVTPQVATEALPANSGKSGLRLDPRGAVNTGDGLEALGARVGTREEAARGLLPEVTWLKMVAV